MELEKSYDHTKVGDKIYKQWMDSGYFNPDNLPNAESREPFTISLPPPNVTGVLHMGHAFEDTIQDAVTRFQRMNGKRALWVPGTDHAAIATQAKFEKEHYKKDGKSRHDYSREDFFAMIQKFAMENQAGILSQLHKLGLSLDWSRLAFTLDEKRELAVQTAFKKMYEAGLIYRGDRVVNWDPKGQTTVSDDEIEHEETKATLYTFRYSKDFPISISTTRPETKVGDTAVAVNPHDDRYKQYVGKEYDAVFCNVPLHIKIIADESVEKDFGTGALGVTPSHSMTDYEIAQPHNLPLKTVINEFAKMTVGGQLLEGKKTSEAREIVTNWLRENKLMEKEEAITQNLSKAQRTGGVIEPLPKLQWFIDVNKKFKIENSKLNNIKPGQEITLKELMIKAVQSGQIKIMPERFEKIYFHWIDNLRDWCISRQIIYGHRIPVWYKGSEIYCGIEAPQGQGWQQDSDTLDTWFSSGLWTFSTLGWPSSDKASTSAKATVDRSEGKPDDLKIYHPTSVMMPGYEILFFWVARMILMSGFLLGDIPFKQVVLHGMVRDKQGRKFSKSLNNGVNPLDMTQKYGTDALRMALVFGSAAGNDLIFDEQKVKGMKHFANKLWNITRFIISNTDNTTLLAESTTQLDKNTDDDKVIIQRLDQIIKSTTEQLENYQLHIAAQSLYGFIWYDLADTYVEASKAQLTTENLKENTQKILLYSLVTSLKLLHPFMPFITEEIWGRLKEQNLLKHKDLLIVSKWPQ